MSMRMRSMELLVAGVPVLLFGLLGFRLRSTKTTFAAAAGFCFLTIAAVVAISGGPGMFGWLFLIPVLCWALVVVAAVGIGASVRQAVSQPNDRADPRHRSMRISRR